MTRRGWALFAAMCLIWGIPYLLIKVAVGSLSPVTLVFFRTLLGGLLLLPLAAARGSLRPLLPKWKVLVAYTVAEVALPWLLLSDAERRLTSSLTGLLLAAVPFVGVLLSWLTGAADRFDARRLFGLVVGFIGVAALVGLNVSGSGPDCGRRGRPGGDRVRGWTDDHQPASLGRAGHRGGGRLTHPSRHRLRAASDDPNARHRSRHSRSGCPWRCSAWSVPPSPSSCFSR